MQTRGNVSDRLVSGNTVVSSSQDYVSVLICSILLGKSMKCSRYIKANSAIFIWVV